MSWRRALLGCGWFCLVVSAARGGAAYTEVESSAYAGTSTGGWTCGPVSQARYGGVGARVIVAEREATPEHGEGFNARVNAAGEYEHDTLKDARCDNDCSSTSSTMPPARFMAGGAVRGGYRWQYFGAEAGVQAFQGWEHNTSRSPSWHAFPDIVFRAGPKQLFEIETGVGSLGVTTARRPSGWLGVNVAVGGGHRLTASAALARQGPSLLDDMGPRFDLGWRAPVGEKVFLRAGGAVNAREEGVGGGEFSLGVGAALP
jgi:hypothetical protein